MKVFVATIWSRSLGRCRREKLASWYYIAQRPMRDPQKHSDLCLYNQYKTTMTTDVSLYVLTPLDTLLNILPHVNNLSISSPTSHGTHLYFHPASQSYSNINNLFDISLHIRFPTTIPQHLLTFELCIFFHPFQHNSWGRDPARQGSARRGWSFRFHYCGFFDSIIVQCKLYRRVSDSRLKFHVKCSFWPADGVVVRDDHARAQVPSTTYYRHVQIFEMSSGRAFFCCSQQLKTRDFNFLPNAEYTAFFQIRDKRWWPILPSWMNPQHLPYFDQSGCVLCLVLSNAARSSLTTLFH